MPGTRRWRITRTGSIRRREGHFVPFLFRILLFDILLRGRFMFLKDDRDRNRCQTEILLSRLRGGGAMESCEAGAGVPVLRDCVACEDEYGRGDRGARSCDGAAGNSGRPAGVAGGEGVGEMPELPGDHGV